MTIAENLALRAFGDPPLRHGPWLDLGAMDELARERIAEFAIRAPGPEAAARTLSGGNQQKIVLARELDRNPDLLLIGQPTRGVDIGAIEFIHRRLVALRDSGKALLLVSVELDEILALADRILVMHDGRIVGDVSQAEATEQALGRMMAGVSG